jgi:hypothetical protein
MKGSGYGLLLGTIALFTWWMEEDHDKDFGTLRLQGPAIYDAGVPIFQRVHWICSGAWEAVVYVCEVVWYMPQT